MTKNKPKRDTEVIKTTFARGVVVYLDAQVQAGRFKSRNDGIRFYVDTAIREDSQAQRGG